ncbi:MAG TPA: ATP-binding protein [Ruminiclostridium sp.]|nr:ATP-binding protein [Ruminiclostridium sp.]
MDFSVLKKYIISLALGLLCFALSFFSVTIDTAYDLYLLPGLLLLAMVALCYGMRYAVVCCTAGLAMFCPFVAVPANGWGNLVTALFILIWAAGLGLCRDIIKKKKLPFFLLYIFQFAFIAVYFLCNKALIQAVAQYNPPFWYKSYAFTYLPANLINAGAAILAETLTICLLLTNSVLSLPFIKKLFKIRMNGYEKANYIVFLVTCLLALFLSTFSTNGVINGMLSITFTINAYQSKIGNMQFALLKISMALLFGDFLMHFLEYHNGQEQRTREMAETQKAVFESSDDMIWCVNGLSGNIITYNSVAKAFFDAKSGGFSGQKFYDLFDDEDMVLWNDYFDETVKSGHCMVEYYDGDSKRYYQVQLNHIDLGDKKYDIAIFAKDITDEILIEDQTKRMNDELELKVLERTKETRKAYNEMENMCYVIAHEFKSPIRAIGLYNDIVIEENGHDFTGEAADASKKIKMFCDKTMDMIDEILKYSKMKSSKLNLVCVNMNRLIEDSIEELRIIYNTRDIRVSSGRLPTVMGDEILLRCCVYNILSNSVKYSSKNRFTDIQILHEDARDENIFYFKDNGVGFDKEFTKNLFQMFGRIHPDSEFEGTGIGLVTVKSIIEKHGGKINIDAKVNEGCTVCFTIPK